jgi:hypothetical protein
MTDAISQLTFVNAIKTLLDHLRHGIQTIAPGSTIGFLIILHNPIFLNADHLTPILTKLCFILATLEKKHRFEFALAAQKSILFSTKVKAEQAHIFQQSITLLQQFLTLRIVSSGEQQNLSFDDDAAIWAIQSLSVFGTSY